MIENPKELLARIAESERKPTQGEIDRGVMGARRPALLLNKTKFPDDTGEPGCWLGGAPTLPLEIEWPYHEVEGISLPLVFVAQIDVSRIPKSDEFPKLPDSGTLFFFCDPHFGSLDAKIIYVAEEVSDVAPRQVPSLPDPNRFSLEHLRKIASDASPLKKWNFQFLDFDTYHIDHPNNQVAIRIGEAAWANLDSVRRAHAKRWSGSGTGSSRSFSLHHLFGCSSNQHPPPDAPILLLSIGADADVGLTGLGMFQQLFWMSEGALESWEFDEMVLTTE